MRVVIMGCGRVGVAVGRRLDAGGHHVVVIDLDPGAFDGLGADFGGHTVTGVGFDRDVLSEAGIETADAFAAVSSGDNSNIIAARVVRETFGIERVVARIYDPRRAEVYERLGIPTIASVRWSEDQIVRRLLPAKSTREWTDGSGRLQLVELAPGDAWVGSSVRELEVALGVRVAGATRAGAGAMVSGKTVVQDGDRLHVMVEAGRHDAAERLLAAGPED